MKGIWKRKSQRLITEPFTMLRYISLIFVLDCFSEDSVVIVQSLSHVQLFVTPWTAAHQVPLSSTIAQSLHRFMSIQLLMLSNNLILYHPLLLLPSTSFPTSGSFPVSWLFTSDGQSIRYSASATVLPMNIQGWFPFRSTGSILQTKGLSRVFSSTTIQKHQFFSAQPSLWSSSHICTWLLEKLQLLLYRCPKTIKQWWHETHILPSELSKLMTPRTGNTVGAH